MEPTTIDDSKVIDATGKPMNDWFALLDKRDATSLTHTQIASMLTNELDVPGWWAQTITVAYERARGMRKKHERPDGFEISVSRTLTTTTDLALMIDLLTQSDWRESWLGSPMLEVSSVAKNGASVHFRNVQTPPERVTIALQEPAAGKLRVMASHSRIADEQLAAQRKAFWKQQLEALTAVLSD